MHGHPYHNDECTQNNTCLDRAWKTNAEGDAGILNQFKPREGAENRDAVDEENLRDDAGE